MLRQPISTIGVAALTMCLALSLGIDAKAFADPQAHDESAKAAAAGEGHESAAAGHDSAAEPNILEPQPGLALWTVVVFVGLMLVLGKFAWKPLLDSLHHREEHLLNVLQETERARNEGEALLAEHRRQLQAAEEQIRAMIEEGKKNARAVADEITKKAQAEAEASKVRAQRDIGSARDQALSEIWSKTADLAVSVAGKVLDKSITGDDHRRLIETAIAALPSSNGSSESRGV